MKIWQTAKNRENRMQAQLQDAYDSLCDQGHEAMYRTKRQVKRRPLSSVAGAFALGLALGVLINIK